MDYSKSQVILLCSRCSGSIIEAKSGVLCENSKEFVQKVAHSGDEDKKKAQIEGPDLIGLNGWSRWVGLVV